MTSPATAPALARARAGTLVVFAANGFVFASWMSRIPAVRDAFGLTPGQLSQLLLALSVGSLIGLPVAGRITQRFDARGAVRGGAAVSLTGLAAALLAVAVAPSHLWLLPGMFFYGLGIGVWDVAQNLQGAAVEHRIGRSVMPWFHAAFSGGTVAGALAGVAAIALGLPVPAHLLLVAAAALALVVLAAARFVPAVEHDGGDAAARPARTAWTEPRTLLVGVMVMAAAFTEGTANDWLAVAFIDGHGLADEYGVVALAVFLTFMTLARVLGTRLLDRHGRQRVLAVLFSAALVGCALVVFGPTWLAFVGAAIWGIGASLGFPVGMSAASDEPARAPARVAVVSTIGYTAFLAGPALIGAIGDHVGVLRALLAVGAAALLALLVLPATKAPERATVGA